MPVCIEGVDRSEAGTFHFLFFIFVLFGESDEEFPIDVLHIKWGKVRGEFGVGKGPRRQGNRAKVRDENIHGATMKIGYIKVVRTDTRCKGSARVGCRT